MMEKSYGHRAFFEDGLHTISWSYSVNYGKTRNIVNRSKWTDRKGFVRFCKKHGLMRYRLFVDGRQVGAFGSREELLGRMKTMDDMNALYYMQIYAGNLFLDTEWVDIHRL